MSAKGKIVNFFKNPKLNPIITIKAQLKNISKTLFVSFCAIPPEGGSDKVLGDWAIESIFAAISVFKSTLLQLIF